MVVPKYTEIHLVCLEPTILNFQIIRSSFILTWLSLSYNAMRVDMTHMSTSAISACPELLC